MTLPDTLRDVQGRPVRPGRLLGEGGEGRVHALDGRPGEVVKLATRPVTDAYARRLNVLGRLATPDLLAVCAWPLGPVVDGRGRTVGFLMPEVTLGTHRPLHDLSVQRSRHQHFPHADWRFLVRTARNLAGAVATVHAHGLVIGDLNPNNVLVTRQATVRLIDCDSFQVEADGELFPCGVGMEAFTPPELQGTDLRDLRRSTTHDAFGLATMIFLLLFLGRYPYAGVWPGEPPSMGDAIRRHAYAYGRHASRLGVRPPPGSLPVRVLPRFLQDLFERSFGSRPTARPTAAEWARALDRLERDLATCDINPSHLHPRRAACPWCPLEADLGTPVFREAPPRVHPRERQVARLWNAIEALPIPPPSPKPRSPDEATVGRHVALARLAVSVVGVLSMLAAGIGGAYQATSLAVWVALAILGLVLFVVPRVPRVFVRPSAWIARGVARRTHGLREASPRRSHERERERLARIHERLKRLAEDERASRAEVHRVYAARTARQRLARTPVSGMPGLNEHHRATLAEHGVRTALDLTFERLKAVPGLGGGQVTDLLHWRLTLEREGTVAGPDHQLVLDLWRVRVRFAWRRMWGELALRIGPARLRGVAWLAWRRERILRWWVEGLLVLLAWLDELASP